MKWKKRKAELERLRAKHGKDRSLIRSFPDLSVEQRSRVAPLSNRLSTPPILKKEVLIAILGPEYTISHLHKSGYQVFRKTDAPSFGKKI
jgi:hypothetical protein